MKIQMSFLNIHHFQLSNNNNIAITHPQLIHIIQNPSTFNPDNFDLIHLNKTQPDDMHSILSESNTQENLTSDELDAIEETQTALDEFDCIQEFVKNNPSAEEIQDISLMKLAQCGDEEAKASIWNKYEERIHRVAFKLLKNEEEAKDVTQEVYIKFINNLIKFDCKMSPAPWFYRMTKNYCINIINRFNRHPISLIGMNTSNSNEEFDKHTDYYDYCQIEDIKAINPNKKAVLNEAIKYLKLSFSMLHDEFKLIIRLKYSDYLSYGEISDYLDIPIGTVMSRLYNAKKKLRKIFIELSKTDPKDIWTL